MSTVRRIAKNAAFLYSSHLITSLLAFALMITIARVLGDVTLGKYSFAQSFSAIFAVFLDIGFDTVIVRDVAQNKTLASKYLGNISIIKVILSIIVYGSIVLIINAMNYPSDTTTAVLIFGGGVVITSFANVFRVTFRAFEQMQYEAMALIITRLVIVSLGFTALYLGYDVIGIAYAFLIGSVVDLLFSFIICTKKFAKPKFEVDLSFWKKGLAAALPMGFSYAAATIYARIDTIMLSTMHGDAVVGWYNAAHNLPLSLSPIFSVIGTVMFPLMASFFVTSRDSLLFAYQKLFRYLFIIGLPLATGIMLLSDRIIPLLYGTEFDPSIGALQILSWGLLLSASGTAQNRILISMHKQNQVALIAACGAILNVILNFSLIPSYSLIGAGIATIATRAVLFGITFFFVSKYLYRLPLHKIMLKPVISCALMGLFLFFSDGFNLAVTIIAAIILYFGSFILIKGFSREDRDLMTRVIRRRRINRSKDGD